MARSTNKKWAFAETIALADLYTNEGIEIKHLAVRFNCTVEEIVKTLKEMGIYE